MAERRVRVIAANWVIRLSARNRSSIRKADGTPIAANVELVKNRYFTTPGEELIVRAEVANRMIEARKVEHIGDVADKRKAAKASAQKRQSQNAERNARVLAAHRAGQSQKAIAIDENVSEATISRIINPKE